MKHISFTFSIYPSMSRVGLYAVSISSNDGSSSIVLGTTDNVDQVKDALNEIISEGTDWSHDPQMNVHTMEVVHPL